GAAGARRVLEAARCRADVRLRAADVHHRRRRAAADPADGDHTAARLLRRLERGRELPPAGWTVARLEPCEPGDAALNKQISHLGVAAAVLPAGLIVGVTYWQTWANASLAARQDNDIKLVASFTIKRGKIYASDGQAILATNVRKNIGGQTLYFRRYPTGPLFSNVVGYSTPSPHPPGLEPSDNHLLPRSHPHHPTRL